MSFYNGKFIPGMGANVLLAQVDDTYNPESENAPSGKALAEALNLYKEHVDELVGDIDAALFEIMSLQGSYTATNAVATASEGGDE